MGNKLDGVALGFSMIALGISAVVGYQSSQATDRANNIASSSNKLTSSALELQKYSITSQVASRVFLGEAPPRYEPTDSPIYAVTNASPVDVYDVWVDGRLPNTGPRAVVKIGGIQRCTLYTINAHKGDFEPHVLHFFDGIAHWTRTQDGVLSVDKEPNIPKALQRVNAPLAYPVVGSC